MKNLEQAKQDFNNEGINSIYTISVKTQNGNYGYFHILNGNSPRGSKIYNSKEGKIETCENPSYVLEYLIKVLKLEPIILEGYLSGEEVEDAYIRRINGELLSSIPPINIYTNIK